MTLPVRQETAKKYFLIGVATLGYLIADYDLISVSNRLFSIRNYIQYYNEAQQQLLFSCYNILGSLNIMIFILCCIYIINEQKNTIQEVNEWSRQLQYANERLKEYNEMTGKMAETRERNRVAREIHDTLGHTLTGVSAGVEVVFRSDHPDGHPDAEDGRSSVYENYQRELSADQDYHSDNI